jgi:hypothetical protein
MILSFTYINWQLEKKMYSIENQKLTKEIKTIVCGNSRLQLLTPEMFIEPLIITSAGGEDFYMTYWKIKSIINLNTQVDHVILSVGFDQFLEEYRYVNHDSTHYIYPYKDLVGYWKYIDRKEFFFKEYIHPDYWKIWLKKMYVPTDFENTIKILLKYKLGKIEPEDIRLYGSRPYISYASNYTPENTKIYADFTNAYSVGTTQEKWFFKIVDLCLSHKIKLDLVYPPFPPLVLKKIRPKYFTNFERIIKKASAIDHSIRFIDYSKIIYPDSCYGDAHHINSYSAPSLAKKIEADLLNN